MMSQDFVNWELSVNKSLNAIDVRCGDSSFDELKAAYDDFERKLQAEAREAGLCGLLRRLIAKRLFVAAFQHDRPLIELEQYFDSLESPGDTFSGLSRQLIRARYLIEHGKHDEAHDHLSKLDERLTEAGTAVRDLLDSL